MLKPLSDLDLLARLVEFQSVSGTGTSEIASFVCDYLDGADVDLTRVESEDGASANLLLRTGPEASASRGLTLSGHMDVVPAAEPGWTGRPFQLREAGGLLYGRGSADMKAFVALAMNRFRAASEAVLDAQLALLLTYDEEFGSIGAQRLTSNWPDGVTLPRTVIVGEPTRLRAVRMHMGHLKVRIITHGVAAHSGYPHRGKNAISDMGRAMAALDAWSAELSRARVETSVFYPETPHATLNPAVISGGEAINVVPEMCTLDLGIRLLPGMDWRSFESEVRGRLSKAIDGVQVELIGCNPPLLSSEGSALYLDLCRELGQDETHALALASDAGPLSELGFDCVLFGPGSIEVAHKPDEHIAISDIERAGNILDALISRRCASVTGEHVSHE